MHKLHHLVAAGLALSLAATTAAQTLNCQQIAHVDRFPGATTPTNNYAGVWGMVINGKEYAIVTARTGTLVYDCSNPGSPVELGFVSGAGGTSTPYFWREANGMGNYAYISSEHAAAQVIDLAAATPSLAGTFGIRAHTVSVDPDTQRVWLNGGQAPRGGCNVYDLNTSAVNPSLAGSYGTDYVHDCYPYRGYAYLGQIFAGNVRILNTQAFPTMTIESTRTTPGAFTHNAWVNEAATVMVTADENHGGCLTFWDITFKSAPVQLSTWCSPTGATVHNAFIKGKICHTSSYSAGYYAVDISDPANPQLIASFDTSAQTNNDYHGCWGCYPFQPSGVMYLTDMQTGFWIAKPTCGVPNDYGTGTAGTGGKTPAIDYAGGFAKVNRPTFGLECTDLAPNAPTALFIAAGQANVPVFGITVNIDLGLPFVMLGATASAQGAVTFGIPIPNVPGYGNVGFNAQVVTADANGPQGLAASRGFALTICP